MGMVVLALFAQLARCVLREIKPEGDLCEIVIQRSAFVQQYVSAKGAWICELMYIILCAAFSWYGVIEIVPNKGAVREMYGRF